MQFYPVRPGAKPDSDSCFILSILPSYLSLYLPIDTDHVFQPLDKVQRYRACSETPASMARPTTPLSILSLRTIQTTNLPPLPSLPVFASPTLPTLLLDDDDASNSACDPTPSPRQRLIPPSPRRKGTVASERELDGRMAPAFSSATACSILAWPQILLQPKLIVVTNPSHTLHQPLRQLCFSLRLCPQQ